MKTFFAVMVVGLMTAVAPARAEVQVQISVGLPVVLPPLVMVQPGVQVVSEVDEEIYFVDGWYWVRRGPHWYRARDHRGYWMWVQPRLVPVRLVRIPPGQYRKLQRAQWKEERKEWKEREKAEHARWKAEEKAWKKEHKGKHGKHDGDDD